jgi:hypothetical protein
MSTEPNVTASSNPVVAKRHGLTKWDRARGQWVKPADPEDAGTELEQPDSDEPARNPFADGAQVDAGEETADVEIPAARRGARRARRSGQGEG